MQKKLRGLDELEKRVAKLEKQLAGQSKKPAARRKSTTAPMTAPAPKPPAE
jgi:BMFP domain-containing protein YqiC